MDKNVSIFFSFKRNFFAKLTRNLLLKLFLTFLKMLQDFILTFLFICSSHEWKIYIFYLAVSCVLLGDLTTPPLFLMFILGSWLG